MKAKSLDAMLSLVGTLKALHTLHYQAHWTCGGEDFYENHLMFERLLGGLLDFADGLAEKAVAAGGPGAIPLLKLAERELLCLKQWKDECLIARSLAAERNLQSLLKETHALLEKNGDLSLGLDNFLQGIADARETAIFLLSQAEGCDE